MLVAFDFDGTLTDAEVATLLGEEHGTAGEIAGITNRAVNGDVDYAESLRERATLLEGLPDREARYAFDRVRLRPHAAALLTDLRTSGHHVAIVTGSFQRGVESALEDAGVEVDTVAANRLPTEQGALTGEVEGPLLSASKDEILDRIATRANVPLGETMAIGDGANDRPMLQAANDAVGFRPAPVLVQHCDDVFASVEKLHLRLDERGVV